MDGGDCAASCDGRDSSLPSDAAGESGPDGSDATVEGASESGAVCPDPSECDDGNPCTSDGCDAGACVHVALPDGTPCDDGKLCTTQEMCSAGACVGSARTSAARVVGAAYAFGGARLSADSESSGGLVTFLSPDRILFADTLDSGGTLLTLATVSGGGMTVAAQATTDTQLVWQPLNGWVWQSLPLSHVVALPGDRFALVGIRGIQVYQATSDGKLVELSRFNIAANTAFDAAWAGDALLTCASGSVNRYALASDGSLSQVATPELAGVGCLRLAVTSGGTVYAAATAGVTRWSAVPGQAIVPEVVLPGVSAIDLGVDDTYLALQRVGSLDAFGSTEAYRLADFTRVAAFAQDAGDIPVGSALVGGKLLVEWRHVVGDVTNITGAMYDLSTADAGPAVEWPIRSRCCGADLWAPNVSRLASLGGRVLLQPWRRVADIDPTALSPTWITGPGHGEIAGLQSAPGGQAATFSPYSVGPLDLSSGVRFAGGGMSLAPDVQRLEVVLPIDGTATDAFVATTDPAEQRASVETVMLLRSASSGVEVAGSFTLDGGPAKLIRRGRSLYQIASVGDADYRVRVYALASSASGQSPLGPKTEVTVSVPAPAAHGRRIAFLPEVDADLGQLAVTELWLDDGAANYALVWASLGAAPTLIAQQSIDALSRPLVHGGELLLVDPSRARLVAPSGGGVRVVWSRDATGGDSFLQPLGLDGSDRVYLSANTGSTLVVLGWSDGTPVSRIALPDAVRIATTAGDHLLLAGSRSVSILDPACGDAGDDTDGEAGDAAPTDDAAPTGDGAADAHDSCGVVPNCPDGGLTRSTLAGDANGDGCVDSADVQLVTGCLGRPVGDVCSLSYLADLDRNGSVDTRDYLAALQNAGHGCDGGM
jgi:hypothetical protein